MTMSHQASPATAQPPHGAVQAAFAEVFSTETVGAEDDFFDLGGDSLLAEELATRLSAIAGRDIRISSIFDYPTPATMAAFIGGDVAPLQAAPEARPPIFLVHGSSGYTMPRPRFFEGLAPDQKVELFQLPGFNGDGPIPDNVPDIAAAYIDQIDRDWPTGRVHLGAFCNGSVIAVEMARQMAERGRPADHLVLLDPGMPRLIKRFFKGKSPRLRSRIHYWFPTGRFTGGRSLEDLRDPKLRKYRSRLVDIEYGARKLAARFFNHKAEDFRPGRNPRAKARLNIAWGHFWPARLEGVVDVICSEERKPIHEDESSFWRKILPGMRIWTVVESHSDVTGAESPITAIRMQELFDLSEGRQPGGAVAEATARATA
ncbi:MAG: thioesterase domain-containing protein [Celeribacter sp.]|jgi:acyl carrier protein